MLSTVSLPPIIATAQSPSLAAPPQGVPRGAPLAEPIRGGKLLSPCGTASCSGVRARGGGSVMQLLLAGLLAKAVWGALRQLAANILMTVLISASSEAVPPVFVSCLMPRVAGEPRVWKKCGCHTVGSEEGGEQVEPRTPCEIATPLSDTRSDRNSWESSVFSWFDEGVRVRQCNDSPGDSDPQGDGGMSDVLWRWAWDHLIVS